MFIIEKTEDLCPQSNPQQADFVVATTTSTFGLPQSQYCTIHHIMIALLLQLAAYLCCRCLPGEEPGQSLALGLC